MKIVLPAFLKFSKLQWSLILFFIIAIYLSLGLDSHQLPVYRATLAPAINSNAPITVVFYGHSYQRYKKSGAIQVPGSGWSIETRPHRTILTAQGSVQPLSFYSTGSSTITVGLPHHPAGGVVQLLDSNNRIKTFSLQLNTTSITIGGLASDVPQSGTITKHYPILACMSTFFLILALLVTIAQIQLRKSKYPDFAIELPWREIVYFASPLFLSTTILWLCFWPASTAWDGSLHWSQAVLHDTVGPYGRTTTLFMRLFTYFSTSPAPVIFFQSLFSAIGISLILRELRYRGVARWVAQGYAIVLAILPAYPTFFNDLGKDALCAVGIIFLAWSLLSITRHLKTGRLSYFSLVVMIIAAVFAGLMRVDVMPTVILMIVLMVAFLFLQQHKTAALSVGLLFFMAILFIPKIEVVFSNKSQAVLSTQETTLNHSLPKFTSMANLFYVYHLFSAAVNSNVPLSTADTKLFYQIAPHSAWKHYTCYMTDTTTTAVAKEILLDPVAYQKFLDLHKIDLAIAVARIIRNNPSILIDRQICISKMLWHIGYGQLPFMATATLGYDNVNEQFRTIAGENRTLLSESLKATIIYYIGQSAQPKNFWFFWKPALMLYLGLFCVLFRLTIRHDSGLLFMLLIPVALTLVLAVLIPFPAYRYAYPATLLMSLFCTLALTPANRSSQKS